MKNKNITTDGTDSTDMECLNKVILTPYIRKIGVIRGSACADRATPERFAQASPPGRKKYLSQ